MPNIPSETPSSAVNSGSPAASSEPSVTASTRKPTIMPTASAMSLLLLVHHAAAELDLQADLGRRLRRRL